MSDLIVILLCSYSWVKTNQRLNFYTQQIPSSSWSGVNRDFASDANICHPVNYTSDNIKAESDLENDYNCDKNFQSQISNVKLQ